MIGTLMHRKKHVLAYLSAVIMFCILYPPYCFAGAIEQATSRDRDTLIYGFTPQIFANVDHADAIELMNSWARITEKNMRGQRKFKSIKFPNLGAAKQALKNKQVDILITIPEEYIQLRETEMLVPVLSTVYGANLYNELLLLVRKEEGITQISQLRDKKMRVNVGQLGTLPLKWLNSLLRTQNLPEAQYFLQDLELCKDQNQTLLPVFFGKADTCIIDKNHYDIATELNPQIGRKLSILNKSPGFLTGVVSARADFPINEREDVTNILANIHKDQRGRQIMTIFRTKRLVRFKKEHLVTAEKLLQATPMKNLKTTNEKI